MCPHGEPAIEWFGNDETEGFTMVQLLTTSSITAHFSLKYRSSAYIDIFSCKEYNAGNIVMFCARYFDATLYESTAIIRGSTKHGPKRTESVLEKNPA
jgi:S-adenosylmethionine/arginine decarboxylase-like enzyme